MRHFKSKKYSSINIIKRLLGDYSVFRLRTSRWYGQPKYVEIWSEKHAIVGTVAELVKDRYVKVAFNKGNPGWGYMYDNIVRLIKELHIANGLNRRNRDREIYIWYLGDDDKYGRHMDREIENQLKFFGLWDRVYFERIGLLPQQVEEFGLPANFETGEGYEVDALNAFNPKAFEKLIDDHSDPYFDEQIHKRLLDQFPAKKIDDLIHQKVKFLR